MRFIQNCKFFWPPYPKYLGGWVPPTHNFYSWTFIHSYSYPEQMGEVSAPQPKKTERDFYFLNAHRISPNWSHSRHFTINCKQKNSRKTKSIFLKKNLIYEFCVLFSSVMRSPKYIFCLLSLHLKRANSHYESRLVFCYILERITKGETNKELLNDLLELEKLTSLT